MGSMGIFPGRPAGGQVCGGMEGGGGAGTAAHLRTTLLRMSSPVPPLLSLGQ